MFYNTRNIKIDYCDRKSAMEDELLKRTVLQEVIRRIYKKAQTVAEYGACITICRRNIMKDIISSREKIADEDIVFLKSLTLDDSRLTPDSGEELSVIFAAYRKYFIQNMSWSPYDKIQEQLNDLMHRACFRLVTEGYAAGLFQNLMTCWQDGRPFVKGDRVSELNVHEAIYERDTEMAMNGFTAFYATDIAYKVAHRKIRDVYPKYAAALQKYQKDYKKSRSLYLKAKQEILNQTDSKLHLVHSLPQYPNPWSYILEAEGEWNLNIDKEIDEVVQEMVMIDKRQRHEQPAKSAKVIPFTLAR